MNKLEALRTKLGMNKTEFGQKLLRIKDSKTACDVVYQMEKTESFSSGSSLVIDILEHAIYCRDNQIPGCDKFINHLLLLADKGDL